MQKGWLKRQSLTHRSSLITHHSSSHVFPEDGCDSSIGNNHRAIKHIWKKELCCYNPHTHTHTITTKSNHIRLCSTVNTGLVWCMSAVHLGESECEWVSEWVNWSEVRWSESEVKWCEVKWSEVKWCENHIQNKDQKDELKPGIFNVH